MTDVNSDESKGALGTRPPSPIFFFKFMQIFGENGQKNNNLWGWSQILDLPLVNLY